MAVQPRGGNDLRGLKALVGILGVLVILGTALVIGVVIHRLYGKAEAAAPAMAPGMAPATPTILPPAPNMLPAGEHITGIAGAGGDVAVWVSGPAGDRILLLDPATGKLSVAMSAPR